MKKERKREKNDDNVYRNNITNNNNINNNGDRKKDKRGGENGDSRKNKANNICNRRDIKNNNIGNNNIEIKRGEIKKMKYTKLLRKTVIIEVSNEDLNYKGDVKTLVSEQNKRVSTGKIIQVAKGYNRFKKGDKITFLEWSGQPIITEGKELIILKNEEILCGIEND